jgi:hypothetical protein
MSRNGLPRGHFPPGTVHAVPEHRLYKSGQSLLRHSI